MSRVTVFGVALWLLVGTICVFGFWVGDTAQSAAEVRERFAAERAAISDTGDSQTARVGSGLAHTGLYASERVALWTYRTEATLVGGAIELLVLVGLAFPPAAASWRGYRSVRRWAR